MTIDMNEPMALNFTIEEGHVLLDALIAYMDLGIILNDGAGLPPRTRVVNMPLLTQDGLKNLYQKVAGQIGTERRDVRYPANMSWTTL